MSLVDLSAEEVAGKNGFDDCSAQKMNKMTPKKATIGPWKNQLDDFRRDAKNRWKPLETQTFDGLSIEF